MYIEDVVLSTPFEVKVMRTGIGEFTICGSEPIPGSSAPGFEVGAVNSAGWAGDPPSGRGASTPNAAGA